MPSTDPVSSINNCYSLRVSYTDPVHSFIISWRTVEQTGSSCTPLPSISYVWITTIQRPNTVRIHQKLQSNITFRTRLPRKKRENIPIEIDYPVHAFRLELSEVRMDGHSGWMRLWFLTIVGQNMHDWPKKSHSFNINCGWSQLGLALINGSLARVLHREGDNAVRWIRALAWI